MPLADGTDANAAVDAGAADSGVADSGTDQPDAAVPTTTISTDAGVTIVRYDYDAGTDCDGLIPSPEKFRTVTIAFAAAQQGCPSPLTDESGVIALGTGGAPPIGEYALVSNDLDAGFIASFAPGIPHESLRGEPLGFSAAVLDGGWTFTRYDRDGVQFAFSERALAPADTSSVSPLPSGGYALVVGDAASSKYLLQTVTAANDWRLGTPIILDAADGGVMVIDARASQEGNLILQRRSVEPVPYANRWYAIDGTPLSGWFAGYSQYLAGVYSMLGGVVFDEPIYQDGAKPDYYWFAPDPTAAPAKPPEMDIQWAIVRGARAYANWGEVCFWNGTCWRNPNQMDLLSRTGLKCASLYFDPEGTLSVGRDGTVIQQSGCAYRWYPQLLR